MSELLAGAEKITEKYRRWSFVAGVVPAPAADLAAVSAVNLKMLSDLSDHYGVAFSEDRAKKIVGALLGGVVPIAFATGYVGSAIKAVPGFGTVLGAFTMPVFASASTTAVGRIFINHFEGGGTLDDLVPENLKASVKDAVDKAVEKSGEAADAVKGAVKKAAKKSGDAAAAVKGAVKKAATKSGDAAAGDVAKPAAGGTNMTQIQGIGPKLQELLKNAGIETLEQLAAAEVSDLQAILDQAGNRYRLQDPSTWPEKAKAALDK